MSKNTPRSSAARRNAEALMSQSKKRELSFKAEQERDYESMLLKTARLRELRLAKEAEEQNASSSASAPTRPAQPRTKRSRQT